MVYDVFLSHNSRDRAAIDRIASALENSGVNVFLDRWYLSPGQPWPQALEQAIGSCGAVAVCIGPNGMGTWQHREQSLALDRQAAEEDFPVIPILLPGSDPPLGFLRLNTWVDLRGGLDDASQLAILEAAIQGQPLGPGDQENANAARTGVCPYRGLQVFREEDAEFFCGRDDYVQQLSARITKQPFTVIVGASGSGKSSLVKAGVIPQLRRLKSSGVWEISTVIPGETPLHSFAAAVLPPDPDGDAYDHIAVINKRANQLLNGEVRISQVLRETLSKQPGSDRILLFVDQWEELYTSCKDEAARDNFIAGILSASSDPLISVVATLRGDFYGKALTDRNLADRMQGAIANLGPMTEEELRQSIQVPASSVGLTFEAGLVDRIIDDVGNEPGNLPLLEFVLKELWGQRRNEQLTHRAYDSMQGVQGAIASRAESVIRTLSNDEIQAARRLLVQMVRPGEGTEDTRRRTELPPSDHPGRAIIETLAIERLIVTTLDASSGREMMEVTHEALIRNWETLRNWVDEDRELLMWRQRLRSSVVAWERTDKNPDSLLRGPLLTEALGFVENPASDLSASEKLFIDSSRAQRRKEEQEVDRQLAREQKIAHQKKRMLILSSGLVFVLVFSGIVTWFWRAAELQRDAAEAAEAGAKRDRQYAVALNLASQSRFNLGETADAAAVSVLLAIESLRTVPTPDGYAAWVGGLDVLPYHQQKTSDQFEIEQFLTFDLSGTSSQSRISYSTRNALGGPSIEIGGSTVHLMLPIRGRDGALIAAAAKERNGRITLVDVETGNVDDIVFDEDYERFAVANVDSIRVFDTSSGKELARLAWDTKVKRLAFVGSDEYATIADDGAVILWTDDGGTQVIDDNDDDVLAAPRSGWAEFFNESLVTTSRLENTSEGVVAHTSFHDVSSGQQRLRAESFFGPNGIAASYAVSDDQSLLATRIGERAVAVKDIESSRELFRANHDCCLTALTISPSGRFLAFAYTEIDEARTASIELWDVRASRLVRQIEHPEVVRSLVVDDSAEQVHGATANELWVWRPNDDETPSRLDNWNTPVRQGPYLSSAGRHHILSIRYDPGEIRVIDTRTSRAAWATDTSGSFYSFAVSQSDDADRSSLTFASSDGSTVQIWTVADPETTVQLPHEKSAWGVALDDSRRLVVVTEDQRIHVWNHRTQEKLFHIDSGYQANNLSLSPNGRWLALWQTSSDQVRVWNLDDRLEVIRLPIESTESATFSVDSNRMITLGADGSVRIWPLEVDDVTTEACSRVWRNLTDIEWRQFMGSELYRATCDNLPMPDHPELENSASY